MIIYGWHHYARSGVRTETRRCPHCGRIAVLESFDAFLWGHLYFVPLLPLGRRHVWDKCQSCGDMRDAPLARWEAERQAGLARVEEHFGRDKDNAEHAWEALEIYSLFGTIAQVTSVAAHLEARHANDPSSRARLAQWFAERGQLDRAARLGGAIEATAEIDDLNRTIAGAALLAGDLLRAKGHLLKLIAPERGADLLPLANLAFALRKSSRLREAHEVLAFTFRHFPVQAAHHNLVVQTTAALERDLGIRQTILPASARPHRDTLIGVGVVATVVVGLVVANLALARYQDLYLVNGTASAATIHLNELETHLAPGAVARVDIAEGRHRAALSLANGHSHEAEFTVDNDLLQRVQRNNTFVLNVLGAAVLVWGEVVYRPEPALEHASKGRHALLGGREFVALHELDYPFTTPPPRLRLDGQQEVRTTVQPVHAAPAKVIAAAIAGGPEFADLDGRSVAEGQLIGGNRDAELVDAYLDWCAAHACHDEAVAFLARLGIEPAVE